MKRTELDFPFPEHLIATERAPTSRVMFVDKGDPCELEGGLSGLATLFRDGDLLVMNDTKVLKRRLFSESSLEILFLKKLNDTDWEVLCPASRWKNGMRETLPGGVELELLARGRPQVVRVHGRALDEGYFLEFGHLPLPPYIQKARGERKNRSSDHEQYQTVWAAQPGSLAAPTASLHFSESDLAQLQARGVQVEKLTLHVGLGTFLPVTADDLDNHVMHFESVEISEKTWRHVMETKKRGGRIFALGTTVARSLESAAHGRLAAQASGGYAGETDLFIRPGFEFRVVDVLLTNFHQPQSTLLALVAAFAGLENVKRCYQWAIEKEFRLFSYGDLSVWNRACKP